eukprot:274308_1
MAIMLLDELLHALSFTRLDDSTPQAQSKSYTVVNIADKCGLGIIATQYIAPSTIIISEEALLRERKHNNNTEKYKLLMDSYHAIPSDVQKKQITSLSNCFSANCARNELINIYYTNCIKIKGNKKYESGLFPHIARINHSCSPNAFWIYENGVMTVRALFDIQKGAEICASYLPPLQFIFRERQAFLLDKYGFVCKCKECTLPWIEIEQRDQIIIKYKQLVQNDTIEDIEKAIRILDEAFNEYPILKMNLLNRCSDILIHQIANETDHEDTRYNLCLEYIEKSINIGLQCYGDKTHNKSDWSEIRKRIAMLRWYASDPEQKCTKLLDKWQRLF